MKKNDKYSFDYSKLKGKIIERFDTQKSFAVAMQMEENQISHRLHNHTQWSINDIILACEQLGIDKADIPLYFFSPKS